MAETKVRLVRCPKCQNVLPELADYSVYQCGGCGAVLRAKAKHSEPQTRSGLDGGAIGVMLSEKSGTSSPNHEPNHSTDLKSNSSSFRSEKRDFENDVVGCSENFESGGKVVEDDLFVEKAFDQKEDTVALVNADFGEETVHEEIEGTASAVGCERIMRTDAERPNLSTSNHLGGDPKSGSENATGKSSEDQYKPFSDDTHQDKVEILRKLEELKQQLSRLPDFPKKPDTASNHHPDYESRCDEECATRHDMHVNNGYPFMYTRAPLASGDPCRSHLPMGVPQQPTYHIFQHPPNPYFSGQYADSNLHTYPPFSQEARLLHPHCFFCCCKSKGISGSVHPTGFCHHENLTSFGSHFCNPTNGNAHPAQLARWKGGIGCENNGFAPHPTQVFHANAVRTCHPVAGGAPFITCFKCLEVLKLPSKLFHEDGKANTVRCGACSTLIMFSIVSGKLLFSPSLEEKEIPFDDTNDGIKEVVNGDSSNSYAHFNSHDSDYEFQSLHQSVCEPFDSSKSKEAHSRHSSSLVSKNSISSEFPAQGNLSPPPAGSPLQEHFDYSSNNHRANRFGNGNRSTRSDQEKGVASKAASRQSSVKDMALESETETSSNEDSNPASSQDSGNTGKESKTGTNKGGDSFLAGIKKSLRDLSRSNQVLDRSKVTINGNPVADRKIKKAEKLAGPIYPGQYWYDYRAGFWGVKGGPCLGIVPPYIEEFNFSLPKNCAGGNTGVLVNGRELHEKDLDLLANRGLPTDRDRSYIVEISGKVLDVETGEELDSLGKLAPTVEKVKHGFGMKPSRATT